MQMKPLRFLTFSFICFLPFLSQSQKYSLKEAEDVWDDYLHEQFFLPRTGQTLLFNYASPHGGFSYNRKTDNTTVIAYDTKMRKKYTVEVKELAGKKYETSIANNNSLFIFYTDKDGTVYKTEFDPSNGSTTGTQKVFSYKADRQEFFKGVSPDSSHYFVSCKSSTGKSGSEDYTGVVMDRQMNTVAKFSTSSNAERRDIVATDQLVSNNGTMFILSTVEVKSERGSYYPFEQQIKQITADGNTTTSVLSNLPEGLFDNVSWSVDGNNIVFNGLLSKTKKGNYTSVVSGKFDVAAKKVTNVKEAELAQVSYIQTSTHSLVKDIVKEGIPTDVSLVSHFYNSDKSSYILLEENNSRNHSMGQYYATGGALGSTSQFGATNYFNDNVYVIKLSPPGEVVWLKVVAKKQIQSEREVYSSVAVMKDSKNGLHFFFNDHTKNTDAEPNKKVSTVHLNPKMNNTSLACAYITADGKMTKTILQNNEDAEHFFSPEGFSLVGNNKMLYTSYKARNMGKSTFRLGSLDVK